MDFIHWWLLYISLLYEGEIKDDYEKIYKYFTSNYKEA